MHLECKALPLAVALPKHGSYSEAEPHDGPDFFSKLLHEKKNSPRYLSKEKGIVKNGWICGFSSCSNSTKQESVP
jgi:hypothetical protein